MQLRPCIDIHNGKVKQIVGGSLRDQGDTASENFVSDRGAAYYAGLFKEDQLTGGHVIILNGKDSPYYEATKAEALSALGAYPGGLQIGGGINADNASEYMDAGARHVIVTSYVFNEGHISWENIRKMKQAVGREHLVLDLSCRQKDGQYYIVTNRWQTFTEEPLTADLLHTLSSECDEFLIHGVDVEGKSSGVSEELITLMDSVRGFPITYAGGIASFEDIEKIRRMTDGTVDVTIGSALSLFGGKMDYHQVIQACRGMDSH
ncbi:MAG: phosphoribosylformimino-5-aminoimidazole carboxamide ribotide isomerase [Lachnospiraceae bacterium]|nr:phosphoribosylformimino-5-aminoimidazole carboxamide ribotide isomerase [Candidatus Equihabitans merdae]